MTEEGRFPDDLQAVDLAPVPMKVGEGVSDIFQMGGGVNAPRDGQPDHLQLRKSLPFPLARLFSEHHSSDFDGADPVLAVKGDRQGPSGIAMSRDVGQKPVGQDINGMTSERLEDRDAGLIQELSKKRDLGGPVFEVALVEGLLEAPR
jgi:hypothetical protein